MSFHDFFDINDYFINSILSWNEAEEVYGPKNGWILNFGDHILPLPYNRFYLNARYNGKINLYEDFLNNTFFMRLEGILNSKSMSKTQIPIINIYEDQNGNKHIVFDLNFYCGAILNSIQLSKINFDITDYSNDYDEKISEMRNALREERNCLKDVLNHKKNSIYYNKMLEIFLIEKEKFGNTINGVNITFENLIESKISFCTKMIIACRYLKNFFSKELDFNMLKSCFDYDKFCLLCAKSFFDQLITNDNKISSTVYFLLNYFKRFDEYKKINSQYNPQIKIYDGEKYEIITANDLRNQFVKILEQHEEFNYWEVDAKEIETYFINKMASGEEIDELTIKEFTSLVRMIHKKDSYEEAKRDDIKTSIDELEKLEKSTTDPSLVYKIRQQKDKIEFLLMNNPIKIIRGKGTFSNYYGYVYENGYVVFDVLNSDLNKSYGNASFILPYAQIEELTYTKKTKLRKLDPNCITTIIHKGNWKDRILQKLNEVAPKQMDFSNISSVDIDGVANIEELEKLKTKLSILSEHDKRKIEDRKRKIISMKKVDNDLRTTTNSEDLSFDEFNSDTEEMLNTGITELDKLYELWNEKKNGKKVKRNPSVAAITKIRARDENGIYHCELCEASGFDHRSFDSHHMIPLSMGGFDNIYNTVCLCPNCHRNIHSGKVTLNQQFNLFQKIRNHLIRENPEYIEFFEKMIFPVTENEEYYYQNKEIEDRKFAIFWNGDFPKKK